MGSGGGWVPDPTNATVVASSWRVPFANPRVVGVKEIVKRASAFGARLSGRAGRTETEYGLLGCPIPMFEMAAGRVPVFFTSKLTWVDWLIVVGLKMTELLDEFRVTVVPATE